MEQRKWNEVKRRGKALGSNKWKELKQNNTVQIKLQPTNKYYDKTICKTIQNNTTQVK